MIYLLLTAACLVVAIGLTIRNRKLQSRSNDKTTVGQKRIVLLDDDDPHGNTSSADPEPMPVTPAIVLAIVFAALFIIQRPAKAVHTVAISHEDLGAKYLGLHLAAYYQDSTDESAVRAVIVAPAESIPYTAGLVRQVSTSLQHGRFTIVKTVYITDPSLRPWNDRATHATVSEILASVPRVDLIVFLTGYSPIGEARWPGGKRPFIAVLDLNSEYNNLVYAINSGLVDMAVVSRGQFHEHTLVPRNKQLNDTFNDTFVIVTAGTIQRVIGANKQVVVRSGESK